MCHGVSCGRERYGRHRAPMKVTVLSLDGFPCWRTLDFVDEEDSNISKGHCACRDSLFEERMVIVCLAVYWYA